MKIGFVGYPSPGHLNATTAVARRLQSRGHEVIFIGVPDTEPFVRAAGLTFVPYCEEEFPVGSMNEAYAPVAKMHGFEAVRYTCEKVFSPLTRAALKHLQRKLEETGVEALVLDPIHFFVELVPMRMGIPYIHIWCAHHFDFSGSTPIALFKWPHDTTPEALTRNRQGLQQTGEVILPVLEEAIPYADRNGLHINWQEPGSTLSKLAVITQVPKEFDFPGISLPANFHYAGPFHDDQGREPVPFPRELLNGKPLIYASLGTPIPSNAIIVRTAPQFELLKRAALCITHAGLNTTLEALAQGVPMVALPIAYDQPGVAARIKYHGVGESLEVETLTGQELLGAIRKVLDNPSYRERARYFQEVIGETRGLEVAADRIEQAFQRSTLSTAQLEKGLRPFHKARPVPESRSENV